MNREITSMNNLVGAATHSQSHILDEIIRTELLTIERLYSIINKLEQIYYNLAGNHVPSNSKDIPEVAEQTGFVPKMSEQQNKVYRALDRIEQMIGAINEY